MMSFSQEKRGRILSVPTKRSQLLFQISFFKFRLVFLFYFLSLPSCSAFQKVSLTSIPWVEILHFCSTFLISSNLFFPLKVPFVKQPIFFPQMQCLSFSLLKKPFQTSRSFILIFTLFLLVCFYSLLWSVFHSQFSSLSQISGDYL